MKTIRQTARETDEKYRKVRKSHITVEMSIKSMTSDLLSETKRLKEKLLQVITGKVYIKAINFSRS